MHVHHIIINTNKLTIVIIQKQNLETTHNVSAVFNF